MAQMSLEELYRGESAGEKYGIMGEVMKDFLQNGRPSEYDERTWLEMLLVKHALIAAEKMKSEGDTVSGLTDDMSSSSYVDIAIELALYVMKTQIFNDGNKRTAIIFANHYLIAHGAGLMVVPENIVTEFKQLLVRYYEDIDVGAIKDFLKNQCYRTFQSESEQ